LIYGTIEKFSKAAEQFAGVNGLAKLMHSLPEPLNNYGRTAE
jgi:hypothetical protein